MTAVCVKSVLIVCLFSLTLCQGEKFVKDLTKAGFQVFKRDPNVRIVYFYTDFTKLKPFENEYEKSASLLNMYNVQFATVDCQKHHVTKYCDMANVGDDVYAFRNGNELISLGLENMFDVNSITSNVLQIVLLREVPILQTLAERLSYEEKNKGVSDIIFSYQKAIGTYEHRILMEVAFAYQGKYKFALTTEDESIKDLSGKEEDESSMIWVLRCKKARKEGVCKRYKYIDTADLASLARFLKTLDMDLLHDVSEGENNPFSAMDLHTIVLYYSMESQQAMRELGTRLLDNFAGMAGVLLVNGERDSALQFGFLKDIMKTPNLALILRGSNEPEPMDGEVTYASGEKFVRERLESMKLSMDARPKQHQETSDEDFEDQVEKQDDQVAEAVYRMRKVEIDRQNVPVLTDKTFTPTTTEAELVIVLFYLTFDARSMAFLRSYVEASHVLAQESLYPLAAIDCFDWTDVCGKQNITSYPTIRIYRRGQPTIKYRGMLDAGAIISTVKLFLHEAPVYLPTVPEVNAFIEGNLPSDINRVTNVSVIGLFTEDHKQEIAAFKEAATQQHGKLIFGYTAADITKQVASKFSTQVPSVVIVKRHDLLEPHVVYTQDLSVSRIVQAALQGALPLFPELTPYNFPAYFARKQPFVLLFSENTVPLEGAHRSLATVAQSAEFSHITFAWMELMRPDGVAGMVLTNYNPEADPPAISMVDHTKGAIYNFPKADDQISTTDIRSWLRDIIDGKIKPSKPLPKGEWRPLNSGYDFLRMLDEEARKGDQQDDNVPSEDYMPVRSEVKCPLRPVRGFQVDENAGEEDSKMLHRNNQCIFLDVKDTENMKAEEEIRQELQNLRKSRLFSHHEMDRESSSYQKHTEL